jgi:hypothetical protein
MYSLTRLVRVAANAARVWSECMLRRVARGRVSLLLSLFVTVACGAEDASDPLPGLNGFGGAVFGVGGSVATGGTTFSTGGIVSTGGLTSTGGVYNTGGVSTGGVSTGGVSTGGTSTGGTSTGGTSTGGVSSGGSGSGGWSTGGSTTGGAGGFTTGGTAGTGATSGSGGADPKGPCKDLKLFCFDPFDMFIFNAACFTCNNGAGCKACVNFQAE